MTISTGLTRRELLAGTIVAAAGLAGCRSGSRQLSAMPAAGEWVNDVHSQLNRTRVRGIATPTDRSQLLAVLQRARRDREPVSLCGGRHAGGGQQFLSNRTLVDMSALNRVLNFDDAAGTVEVEAGIQWPALMRELHDRQTSSTAAAWAIHQKQGGADRLSLGGAIAANVHGRCLASAPIVQDVDSLTLVDGDGELIRCSRTENADHFRHAIGGYGMFGVVYSVTLRLERHQKLTRHVRQCGMADAVPWLEKQRDAGALHGDFQFSVDETNDNFCDEGICSWYAPTNLDAPIVAPSPEASEEGFRQIVAAAHMNKPAALAEYWRQLKRQEGSVNWSDSWQAGSYAAGYHAAFDPPGQSASEVLSELYVPRAALPAFMKQAAATLRERQGNLIYGTVRLIDRDDETALCWAKQPWACVIFNLHTTLQPAEIERNHVIFRALLEAALSHGGSYYLTYHRAARIEQTLRCYPELPEVLLAKRRFDPFGRWRSDWFDHYAKVLSI